MTADYHKLTNSKRLAPKYNPELVDAVATLIAPTVARVAQALATGFPRLIKPRQLHPVELAAHAALGALKKGRQREVDGFLGRWLWISEADAETYEALFVVMGRQHEVPLSEMVNPAGWLRRAIVMERRGIFAAREKRDAYSMRIARDIEAEEDASCRPGKVFDLAPRRNSVLEDEADPFTRSKNTGLLPPSPEDPQEQIARKLDNKRRALEELTVVGRGTTKKSASRTLAYMELLEEGQRLEGKELDYERKDHLRIIGGANAERVLKRAAQTWREKISRESR
jgi:hypothetical protein